MLLLRPASWLALLTRTFTFELALAGSPRANVEYDYVGKQSTPTTGLSPASPTALWAAGHRLILVLRPVAHRSTGARFSILRTRLARLCFSRRAPIFPLPEFYNISIRLIPSAAAGRNRGVGPGKGFLRGIHALVQKNWRSQGLPLQSCGQRKHFRPSANATGVIRCSPTRGSCLARP